jgi:D-ala D-ala ligase C-terminus
LPQSSGARDDPPRRPAPRHGGGLAARVQTLVARLGPITDASGRRHRIATERITIEPFNLRDVPRYRLVIDRLAYWYYVPREWLKKAALMNDVYLLNSPFTFQSMEKHAAYCAMMRLGLKVPATVLVPQKDPPDNARFQYTAARYNRPFDLGAVAEQVGYPLFMKPYDGGQWVGVSRIGNREELQRAYDASGQRIMHLQASIDGYDVFARSLSIGPETMVMKFRPEAPMHDRYEVAHDFLAPGAGAEVLTISRLVNAFFRWEFNSCECLVRGGDVHPIDYANASPDVALTSLHYYFPWAIRTLLKWCVFCVVTNRRPTLDLDTRRYFEIGDRRDLTYREKLEAYRRLADEHFDSERYHDFCASRLAHVDELVVDWFASPEFDDLLVETVQSTYPPHEHEQFVAHLRGLVGQWVREQGGTPALSGR